MNLELERLVRAGGRDDDVADGVKPPAPALGCYRLLPQLLCPLLLRILRGRGDGRARESKREQRGQQASYKNESSHRAMRRLVFITCLLPALLALAFSCAPVAATAQDSEKQRAQQLWEQAIAAKGGRGRLYAVRNIVISS